MSELSPVYLYGIILFALVVVVALQSLQITNLNRRIDQAIRRLEQENSRSVSLAKMAHVEASLSELTDAYDALLSSHKKLRSRIGMRAVRAGNEAAKAALPDPQTDPAGYKKAMRLKLHVNKP